MAMVEFHILIKNKIFFYVLFFFKQKTADEIKECDWSSDVCSSDLIDLNHSSKRDINRIGLYGNYGSLRIFFFTG